MKITPDLIPDVVEFSIPNFEQYNPRKDVVRSHWFRMENKWYLSKSLHGLSGAQMVLWPALLGEYAGTISGQNRGQSQDKTGDNARLEKFRASIPLDYLVKHLKSKTHFIRKTLAEFHNREIIAIQNLSTVADVTLRTNERTNERTVFSPANQDSQVPPESPREKPSEKPKREAKSTPVWESYRSAYLSRYRIEPPRNAEVNRHLCSLVDKVGLEDAVELAGFYVGVEEDWLKRRHHPVRNLIQDYQKFLAMMKLGTRTAGRVDDVERI